MQVTSWILVLESPLWKLWKGNDWCQVVHFASCVLRGSWKADPQAPFELCFCHQGIETVIPEFHPLRKNRPLASPAPAFLQSSERSLWSWADLWTTPSTHFQYSYWVFKKFRLSIPSFDRWIQAIFIQHDKPMLILSLQYYVYFCLFFSVVWVFFFPLFLLVWWRFC